MCMCGGPSSTHTGTHIRAHAHAWRPTRTQAHAYAGACPGAPMCVWVSAHRPAGVYIWAHTRPHARAYMPTRALTHTRMHPPAHAAARAHTRNAHGYIYILQEPKSSEQRELGVWFAALTQTINFTYHVYNYSCARVMHAHVGARGCAYMPACA